MTATATFLCMDHCLDDPDSRIGELAVDRLLGRFRVTFSNGGTSIDELLGLRLDAGVDAQTEVIARVLVRASPCGAEA